MKKIIVRVLIGIVVLLIVGAVVLYMSLDSIVKKGVETVGPQVTKVEVKLSAAHLSPFSGSGELSGLFVGNPEGFQGPAAIKVGSIKVKLDPKTVTSSTIVIEEISIDNPEIDYETGLKGSNLDKILANVEAATASLTGTNSQPTTDSASSKKFMVKDIYIKGGKISASLMGVGGTVPLEDIHLQNIGNADKGATTAELVQDILRPMLKSVVKAAGTLAKDATKAAENIGKKGTDQLNNATKGIKGLFK